MKCRENSHLKENSNKKIKSCVCDKLFYYDEKSRNCLRKEKLNNLCTKLIPNCLFCDGSNKCTKCIKNSIYDDKSNSCRYKSGYSLKYYKCESNKDP